MFSHAEVEPSRARLVVDCKEAPDSAADLRDPTCRSAILGRLEGEFGIESVVLSHYVEKQYGVRSMDLLRQVLALTRLMGQLGSRPPSPNFPGLSRRQVSSKCAACPFHPKSLFEGLRNQLARDFESFRGAFETAARSLQRYREEGCRDCTGTTTSDLLFLYREVAAFAIATRTSATEEAGQ